MCYLIRVNLNMPGYYFKNNVSGHSIRRTCAETLAENRVEGLMEMRKKLTSGEKPQKIRRIKDEPSYSSPNQNSSDFSDDDDFSTKRYINDLKTALKEKDAKILKLQKKVEKLKQRQAAIWNFESDSSDSD